MPRWISAVVLSLSIAVAGVGWGHAQQKKTGAMLTAQDYIEIQQLYARYAQALDVGDGARFAATFVPDGKFTGGRAAGRAHETSKDDIQ